MGEKIDYSLFKFPKGNAMEKKKKKEDISPSNRKKIKKLFDRKCGLCKCKGNHIHHIVYRSEDKSKIDDLENMFLLCLDCHDKVHANKKYWQPRLKKMRLRIEKK